MNVSEPGPRRHYGTPPFRIADLMRDHAFLQEARRDAQALITADLGLSQPQHGRLRRMGLRRFATVLDLGDVR